MTKDDTRGGGGGGGKGWREQDVGIGICSAGGLDHPDEMVVMVFTSSVVGFGSGPCKIMCDLTIGIVVVSLKNWCSGGFSVELDKCCYCPSFWSGKPVLGIMWLGEV